MTDILLGVLILLSLTSMLLVLFRRKDKEQDHFIQSVEASFKRLEVMFEQLGKSLKDDFQRGRDEGQKNSAQNRMELANTLETFQGRLEKMRETLNKRISDSFKLVSDRLEQVHKGLGEMQELATGVGDLKKVLSNVKTRGIMGEVQLGNILEQFLAPDQYINNAMIRQGSTESVEFAVKLPGSNDREEEVLLPVDSKFPMEDYQRLMEIYEKMEMYSREEIQELPNSSKQEIIGLDEGDEGD